MTERMNFTKVDILKKIDIPPVGKRARVYDTKVRGLLIDVTSTGVRTFYVRRKVDGATKWFRLGPFPDMSIEQARTEAERFNSSLANGEDPTQVRKRSKEEFTLQDLFDEYIDRHAKSHNKTWKVSVADFNRNAGTLAKRKVSDISYQDASVLQKAIQKERGLYSANRIVQLLRSVYNKGIKWRLIEGENPFKGLELYTEKKRKRFLTDEEVGKLLIEAEKMLTTNSAIHDFVKLDLSTGVRKENLLSMRWCDINEDAKTWTILETKNDESQVIVLHDEDVEILKRRKKEQKEQGIISQYVFAGSGKKTGYLTDLKRPWHKLRKNAGIEDCTIHDLRRSLGSAMAASNFNISVIKHALNHKDVKTTASVYAKVSDAVAGHARAAVKAKWAEAKQKATKDQPKQVLEIKSN